MLEPAAIKFKTDVPNDDDDNEEEFAQTMNRNNSSNKHFGNSIDAEDAEQFVAEFNQLKSETKVLQRRVTVLMTQARKSLCVVADDSGGEEDEEQEPVITAKASSPKNGAHQPVETIHQAHQVHLEIIRKKNAQIDLLMRREQYMVEKYEKALNEKDSALNETRERIAKLESAAITEAAEEALNMHAKSASKMKPILHAVVRHAKALKSQVCSISALVKHEQKVMLVYAQKMKAQVYEEINQMKPPEEPVEEEPTRDDEHEEQQSVTSPFRLTDRGIKLYNQLAQLLGGLKEFANIDRLLEGAVDYVVAEKTRKVAPPPPPKAKPSVKVLSIGVQADMLPLTTTATRPHVKQPLLVSAQTQTTAKNSSFQNQLQDASQRLQTVSEPQRKQLREVLAEATAITKESAAVTMRSVVESVRERRQLQTLQEMYSREANKQLDNQKDTVFRPILRHVFCHQCGKGPFPLQRTWRCTNCYERLHRPPLMTMKRLMENRRKMNTAMKEKYATLFKNIELARLQREAKLEETRRKLKERQLYILRKIKVILGDDDGEDGGGLVLPQTTATVHDHITTTTTMPSVEIQPSSSHFPKVLPTLKKPALLNPGALMTTPTSQQPSPMMTNTTTFICCGTPATGTRQRPTPTSSLGKKPCATPLSSLKGTLPPPSRGGGGGLNDGGGGIGGAMEIPALVQGRKVFIATPQKK